MLERKLSQQAGLELEAELPRPPGSLIEQAERASQRALELERRVGELESQLDERDREILALRDSLRKTIRERNAGPSTRCPPQSTRPPSIGPAAQFARQIERTRRPSAPPTA